MSLWMSLGGTYIMQPHAISYIERKEIEILLGNDARGSSGPLPPSGFVLPCRRQKPRCAETRGKTEISAEGFF